MKYSQIESNGAKFRPKIDGTSSVNLILGSLQDADWDTLCEQPVETDDEAETEDANVESACEKM